MMNYYTLTDPGGIVMDKKEKRKEKCIIKLWAELWTEKKKKNA